jgi:endonuclease YncB( thermonuclease family)
LHLRKLIPLNSKVTLKGQKKDKYRRTLALVVNSEGVNVNLKMIEIGMAALYPYQSGCNDFKSMERQAKNSATGIWSDSSFELPWEYRRRMGIGKSGPKKGSNGEKIAEALINMVYEIFERFWSA